MSVIGREAASGNDTMNMRVKAELLIPRMQYAEEPDFGTEMARIARDFEQRFRTGTEQRIVEELLVPEDQGCQVKGEREDDMEVTRGEKFLLTRRDPAFASARQTLGTVPIAARAA